MKTRTLVTLLLFAAAACSNSTLGGPDAGPGGAGNSGGAGTGGAGGSAVVPCDQAVQGDPCGTQPNSCGALDGYGCYKFCSGGVWNVSCTEAPTCASYPTIKQGAGCLPGLTSCGPTDINSLCGAVSVKADCTSIGWAFKLPCDPGCESLGETDCKMYQGCAWVVPCSYANQPPVAPRCVDFPPRLGLCSAGTCPAGTTCVSIGVNPTDVSSGNCTSAGAAAFFCDP
jgi:hypothetical protein